MAFALNYQSIRDDVITVLEINNMFVPAETTETYIRQLIKGRWIGSGPTPVLCVYVGGKTDERPLTIGQTPLVEVAVTIQILETIPGRNMTSAMKTLLGITEVKTPEQADNEVMAIAQALETWLRGDTTEAGIARRRLNSPVQEYRQVKLGPTTFDNYIYQQGQSVSEAMLQIVVEKRLIDA